jgi:hypothetical protein
MNLLNYAVFCVLVYVAMLLFFRARKMREAASDLRAKTLDVEQSDSVLITRKALQGLENEITERDQAIAELTARYKAAIAMNHRKSVFVVTVRQPQNYRMN